MRSSLSRTKLDKNNGPEIQSFLTPKSERSSNIKECEKKHRKPMHMITSMEKDPASPTKNSSSKRSMQMSVSPKNSRGSNSLKRLNNNGSRTARNTTTESRFNFRIEVMADENTSEDLRASKR